VVEARMGGGVVGIWRRKTLGRGMKNQAGGTKVETKRKSTGGESIKGRARHEHENSQQKRRRARKRK
jgi:hypothetical protein